MRAAMAAALADRIGGDVEVVVDPDPDANPRSPWRTYRHALERTPAAATHRLIVQDDVEVCDGFRAAAEAALAACPDDFVTFFVAGKPAIYAHHVRQAAFMDCPWARLGNSQWTPTVALCWPTRAIAAALAYVDEQGWSPHFRADDEVVGRFMRQAGEQLWATVPSLVEHPDVVPSLVGQRAWGGIDKGRVAACFIGDCDAASIDWSRENGLLTPA